MKRLVILASIISIGLIWILKVNAIQSTGPTTPKATDSEISTNPLTAKLSGTVIWEGFDLSHTNVSIYRDEKLKELYTSGLSRSATGKFELRVKPGKYYIVAYVDLDNSGKFDEGDGYGVLGISNWENETQSHKQVDVTTDIELKGIEIPITARLQVIENEQKLVSVPAYQPSEYQRFKTELSKATSGCRGILNSILEPVNQDKRNIVLAYTDTSWKYRAGISVVDAKTGQWELRLKPGKYYLMGIIDSNSSNRLDDGDSFGFYGVPDIKESGAFPEPVLIKPNTFTGGLEIQINATYMTTNPAENSKYNAFIAGRVIPIPTSDTEIRVEVYPTSALVNPFASAIADSEGRFSIKLPSGEYYIIANKDSDGDGRYSEGDTLGGWGTISISTNPPKMLTLEEGETRAINIQMSAIYDANGQLSEVSGNEQPFLPGRFGENGLTEESLGSITGKVTSFFSTIKTVDETDVSDNTQPSPDGILSISTTPDFRNPTWAPLLLDEDGRFLVDVKPGKYYIMAVVDINRDGSSGTSDGIGLYGTHQPVRGTPATVTVFPGKTTPHVDIDILASYVDDKGTMAELSDGGRWNIARIYGEPEDIFKYTNNGKLVEEWMYWTKGVGFHFEADGAGWKLKDRNEFIPNSNNVQQDKQTTDTENQDSPNGINIEMNETVDPSVFSLESNPVSIFYSHDGVLWRIAPASSIKVSNQISDGLDTRVAPLGEGIRPSASENGTLVYHDFDDNVIIKDILTGTSMVLLDNRNLAQDVTISPDGEYIAYGQSDTLGRTRIVIRHLRSDKTFRIPSTALEMSNPAWRRDGQLLAYATMGTIENPIQGENRNIYAFDQVNNSVLPIVISPSDDAEPTWHPTDRNKLAFSRGTGDNTRQIWIVTISSNGNPTERQITEMGGSRPVWIPQNGRWILYENNGQLWTVDTLTPASESPLMSNGKAVFGYQPIAVSME